MGGYFVNEKDSIKDLEAQARNTKHLMDKLNRAAYGMTFDEAIRLGKENPPPCSQHDEGKDWGTTQQSLLHYITSEGIGQDAIT